MMVLLLLLLERPSFFTSDFFLKEKNILKRKNKGRLNYLFG